MFQKKYLFMYFVAFVASLGGFQFGYEVGILESIKNFLNFKTDFPLLYDKRLELNADNNEYTFIYEENKLKNAFLLSVFCIGCVIGTLIVPLVCDFFGRKRTILFGAAIFGFGSLFAGIISDLWLFYITRIIMGIGIGLLSTICPVYIAETAQTEKRGQLITLYQLMITVGILLAYVTKSFLNWILSTDSHVQWRVVLGNQVIPGFFLLIMMFFLPCSPRYYIWQERDDDALRIVSKLRGISTTRDPEIQSEFQSMKRSLEIEKHKYSISWSEFLSRPMLKRVLIVMGLQALQQFTGINFILNNHQNIFDEIFFGNNSNKDSIENLPLILGFVNVIINVIGTLPTFFLIEKWGRKILLMVGSVGMALTLGISSVADYINNNNNNSNIIYSYVSACGIILFILFFACSWGPVVWVYQSEVFPMRVRSKAVAFCSLANWSCFALIATVYPLIEKSSVNNENQKNKNRGLEAFHVNFIFACCCLFSLLYVLIFVKETKGVVLEDMDSVFESSKEKSKQK
ncbi:general substrate transporter [Piromyces finnis]|uniref:General substrate transporter n=1 Tax=Piromyces finnis TaxID=1754191 RepID=A0A1Y1V1M1_9FUNG|nr:general substrate transporter [Piromyces finnis]|eukprot:ORX44535.1 general substrate transporter [Piromyces finnis]